MSRTLEEIQNQILNKISNSSDLPALDVLTTSELTSNISNLTSSSRVSIWRLWVYIVAFAIWLHEQIVTKNAENSRPHTLRWYKETTLNFLDGLELIWENGQFIYNTLDLSESDLNARKIIKRCAVLESLDGELVIKIAKAPDPKGENLQPLSNDELLRVRAYLNQIKDAGNRIRIINQTPDLLKLNLRVYVDPLIIDLTTGKLLSGLEDIYPVKDAINNYLANLEFNGAIVTTYLIDAIQKASGVKLPLVDSIKSKYSAFPFTDIVDWEVPQAGYYKLTDENLTINYLAFNI